MKKEYDLSKMKSQKNPYTRQLKKQITLRLQPEVIEYFEEIPNGLSSDADRSLAVCCIDRIGSANFTFHIASVSLWYQECINGSMGSTSLPSS